MGEADFDDHLRFDEVLDRQRLAPAAQRDDERLVEQPLDADRAVSRCAIGDDHRVDRRIVRLLGQVVVGDGDAVGARRKVEVDRAVEAAGAHQSRIEPVGAVGRSKDEHVGRLDLRARDGPRRGQEQVDAVDDLARELVPAGRQVEALHLHQQLVDDARCTLAHAAVTHAGTGHADGVELFDEADRAALGAGRVAQCLEELADLAIRHAVEVRLELAGRHEQERDLGLGGDGFGEVGLAGAGGAFEQHAATR